MPWFLALQGPAHITNQSSTYELQEAVDADKMAQELLDAAAADRVVPVPAVMRTRNQQEVTVYVRPAAWGAWTFYELSEEDMQQMKQQLAALSRAVQQRGQPGQPAQVNPITGPPGPASLGSLGNRP